ncbi:MAG: hypothetical protein ACRD2R_01230, partial [Terriglobales bacterium]
MPANERRLEAREEAGPIPSILVAEIHRQATANWPTPGRDSGLLSDRDQHELTLSINEVDEDFMPKVCMRCGAPSSLVEHKTFEWIPIWLNIAYL